MSKGNSKVGGTREHQKNDSRVIVKRSKNISGHAEKIERYSRGDEPDNASSTQPGKEEGHYGGPRKK